MNSKSLRRQMVHADILPRLDLRPLRRTSEHFVRKVRAGTGFRSIALNTLIPQVPWGGRKLSGTGRELGRESIEPFLETKTVVRLY